MWGQKAGSDGMENFCRGKKPQAPIAGWDPSGSEAVLFNGLPCTPWGQTCPPKPQQGCAWLQRAASDHKPFPMVYSLPSSGPRSTACAQNPGLCNAFRLAEVFCSISLPQIREQYRCFAGKRGHRAMDLT